MKPHRLLTVVALLLACALLRLGPAQARPVPLPLPLLIHLAAIPRFVPAPDPAPAPVTSLTSRPLLPLLSRLPLVASTYVGLGATVVSPTVQVPVAGAGFTPGATFTLSSTEGLLLTGTVSVAGFLSATLPVGLVPGPYTLRVADSGGRAAGAAYTVAAGGASGPLLAVAPAWIAPGGLVLAAWAGYPAGQEARWLKDGLCPNNTCPAVPLGSGSGAFTTNVPTTPAAYIYTLGLGTILASQAVQVNAGQPAYGSGTTARAPSDALAAWGAVGEGFLPGEAVALRLNGSLVGTTPANGAGSVLAAFAPHTVGEGQVEKLAMSGATSGRVAYAATYYRYTTPALPGQVQARWEESVGSTALVVADNLGFIPSQYSVLLDGRTILTGTTGGSPLLVYSYTVPLRDTPTHNLTTQLANGLMATSRADILPCAVAFADVPGGDPFYPYVRWLACAGYVSGYACGGVGEPCNGSNDPYYRSGATITRAQLTKMVVNTAHWPINPPATATFADVPPGHPFYAYVETAVSHGLISGYACGGDGEPCDPLGRAYFRPGNAITRGQLSKVIALARAYSLGYPPQPTFADVPTGHPFYPYIEALSREGVISGYTCGGPAEPCGPPANRPYFRPANTATRGQVAKFVTVAYGGP